jgi:hypothetical protein
MPFSIRFSTDDIFNIFKYSKVDSRSMHWGKQLILIVLALCLLVSVKAYDPTFSGCVIATSEGALRDVDCDRTPDPFDNCPLVNNPDQVDRDDNGIGDACDLVIDEVVLEPETPMQGRSMVATVYLMNNRAYPMRNVVAKLEVPRLGVATSEDVSIIQPGQRISTELLVRIPECAQARPTDIVIIAEYPFAPGQKEVFSQALKAMVVPGGTCAQETGSDKTVVNILEVQDIDPVNGALYPFTIHNQQPESKAYVLSTQGLEDWGYAEVHPGTVIVVPAGEARDGAIQVWARDGVQGRKSFTFTVEARDDTKQIVLLANVPEMIQPQSSGSQLFLGLLGFIVVVALVGVALYLSKKK